MKVAQRATSPSITGSVVAVDRAPGGSLAHVRSSSGRVDLPLPVAPDPDAARRCTAGLRRVSWARITLDGSTASCEVAGLCRHPVRRPISLAAALALAESGVPTVLTSTRSGGAAA